MRARDKKALVSTERGFSDEVGLSGGGVLVGRRILAGARDPGGEMICVCVCVRGVKEDVTFYFV